jgi:hypothetical protein
VGADVLVREMDAHPNQKRKNVPAIYPIVAEALFLLKRAAVYEYEDAKCLPKKS